MAKPDLRVVLVSTAAHPCDNKFADCAFASNAHFLVSDDRHFRVLKRIEYPVLPLILLEDFKSWLLLNP